MLRRYLIANGISTLVLMLAYHALPTMTSLKTSISRSFDVYAMDHAILGPIVHRFVVIGRS